MLFVVIYYKYSLSGGQFNVFRNGINWFKNQNEFHFISRHVLSSITCGCVHSLQLVVKAKCQPSSFELQSLSQNFTCNSKSLL